MGSNAVREGAVTSDDGSLNIRAKVLIAGEALMALETTMGGPAEPHALPNLKPFGGFPKCDHCSGHLVAWHKRVLGHPPLVVEH